MAQIKVIQRNAIRGLRRLRVRRQVKTPRGAPKKGSFVFLDSFSLSNTKRLKMKAFLVVSLVSLRDRSRLREKPPKESSFALLSFKIENESISGCKFSFINP